jgi:hypothetical protein
VRPIDWLTPALAQAWANSAPVYSPPWSVWKITPGDVAAADRDRGAQRRPGQLGVVMVGHGEPDHPAECRSNTDAR